MGKGLTVVVRIILAIVLIFFGLNGFFQWMTPPLGPEAAMNFLGAMFATGYMFIVINILFLISGLLLLFNRYVPLALVLLTPITVNILLFHFFLDFAGGTFGYVLALLNIYMLHVHWDSFRPLMKK